jgi:hypothetical protein
VAKIELADRKAAMAATKRAWKYTRRESFFAFREESPPDGCELGLNATLRFGVELILVCRTPHGHLGSTFAVMAHGVMKQGDPEHRHDPPYPTPKFGTAEELRTVLGEGLALYEEIARAIRRETW